MTPETQVSWINKIFYVWVGDLISRANVSPLQQDDLYMLESQHYPDVACKRTTDAWNDEIAASTEQMREPNLTRALFSAFKWEYMYSILPRCLKIAGNFITASLTKHIIEFVESGEGSMWFGAGLVLAMISCLFFASVGLHLYWYLAMQTGMHVRTGLISIVYNKLLRISSESKQSDDASRVINLMSNDTQKIQDVTFYLHFLWVTPVTMLVTYILASQSIGYGPAAIGFSVSLLFIPLAMVVGHRINKVRFESIAKIDARVKSSSEIFTIIKTIKLYALEEFFEEAQGKDRATELASIRHYLLWKAAANCITAAQVPFTCTAAYIGFYYMGGEFKASIAFSTLSIFYLLKWPLAMFTQVVNGIIESRIALQRLQRFLLCDEVPAYVNEEVETESFVSISDGSFSWEKQSMSPTLSNINLNMTKGNLVCVIGPVGSGKTSLLNVLLGEIGKVSGTVTMNGNVSYAPQVPFLLHSSVRDNILFGRPYERERYLRVIQMCSLEHDISILPSGDMTKIGERGVNLSGGQRARIGLARAVYSDADILLLDDPLSAVDANVGNHLFRHCISELPDKIVVLVTHQLQYLHRADLIVVMEGGVVTHSGRYEEMKDKGLDFEELLAKYNCHLASSGENPMEAKQQPTIQLEEHHNEEQDEAEERASGAVTWRMYKFYFGNHWGYWLQLFVAVLIHRGSDMVQNVFMSQYSKSDQISGVQFIWIYFGITLALCAITAWKEIAIVIATVTTAGKLYNRMCAALMRGTMSFFDVTPKGRIIARLSTDTDQMDQQLIVALGPLFDVLFQFIGTFTMLFVAMGWLSLATIPVAVVYYWVYTRFVTTYREMMRIQAISKAPIYSLFGETINGLFTIRAFKKESMFTTQMYERMDANQRSFYFGWCCTRWSALRIDMLAMVIISTLTAVSIFNRANMNPGFAGAALSYALLSSELLNAFTKNVSDVEAKMNSIERVKQYSETDVERLPYSSQPPARDWPAHGRIEFDNVKMRYKPTTPLVLKGLSFVIEAGEKVGIVGRTGAGKSSILQTLFSLYPVEEGSITIDNIDIAQIGTHELRSKLTIIPQEPTIFDGSVRRNLDPTGEHDDATLWNVLERVHLKHMVQQLGALDANLTEEGGNMSVGERQLLCIGRAILRKTKVLVLDEASSSIDLETDHVLQKTIRDEFGKCTVITIAHRLQTIIDSDRIMVMNDGVVAEYDTPSALLELGGIFSQMYKHYQVGSS